MPGIRSSGRDNPVNLDAALLEILACPACKSPLEVDDPAGELVCTNADCGLAYPVRDDIPVLLVDEARKPAGADDDTTAGDTTAGDTTAAAADGDDSATPAEAGDSGSPGKDQD
jgi:uncharacterized protein